MSVKTLDNTVKRSGEAEALAECVHHWLIEPPEGPVSKGVCLKCGEVKEFNNYLPFSSWEKEPAAYSGWNLDFSHMTADPDAEANV
ncbi:MAG: hypothetical protein R6U89_03620 [Dehalococcoidia bacterium]